MNNLLVLQLFNTSAGAFAGAFADGTFDSTEIGMMSARFRDGGQDDLADILDTLADNRHTLSDKGVREQYIEMIRILIEKNPDAVLKILARNTGWTAPTLYASDEVMRKQISAAVSQRHGGEGAAQVEFSPSPPRLRSGHALPSPQWGEGDKTGSHRKGGGIKAAGQSAGGRLGTTGHLSTIAEALFPEDPLGTSRRNARDVLRFALASLQSRFTSGEVLEDHTPNGAQIKAALRAGFRQRHGRAATTSDIERFVEPFTRFVAEYADQLGLVGTRPAERTERDRTLEDGTVILNREKVSAVVTRALSLIGEIDRYFDAIPDANQRLATLKGEAHRLSGQLKRELGADESLRQTAGRAAAYEAALRIASIRDELRLSFYEATTDIDWDAADSVMARMGGEIDSWLESSGNKTDASLLKPAVRTYAAYWLAFSTGSGTGRITFSEDALENAVISATRGIDDIKGRRHVAGLANRLIHHLIRFESQRGRLPREGTIEIGTDGTEAAAKAIITPNDLWEAVGPELYGNLNSAYAAIADDDDETARNFFEFIFHYIRFAANTYGKNMQEELRSHGLEPRIVRAIFARIDNPSRFDGEVLERVREFFDRYVMSGPPTADELLTAHIRRRMEAAPEDIAAAEGFIAPRDGMAEFIAQIPGMDSDRREEFEESTGISFEAFTRWGQIRKRPETLAAKDWKAMVRFSAEEDRISGGGDRLKTLVLRHKPSHVTEDAWERDVAEAASEGEESLIALAAAEGNRPREISGSEWDEYIERLRAAERLEDVTIEPRMGRALDAILPAYRFMQAVAGEGGLRIDFMDFLAAIYPIARRLRARAEDGTIHVTVPRFMRRLPYHNWGYPTWAAQVLSSGVATDVVRGTLMAHLSARAENPEYWDIKRYTGPLAAATGGADQEGRLYEFAAGLMRWAYLADNALHVTGGDGSLLTNPSGGIEGRYHIQLEDDDAEYIAGGEPLTDSHRQVFAEARRGVFREMLAATGNYLSSLILVSRQILEATGADGNAADIGRLHEEYEGLAERERLFSALLSDRSPTAAYRTQEDVESIRQFYIRVREFADRVVHLMAVRGVVETGTGAIGFQTVPRTEGDKIALVDGEYVTVPVDDIANVSAGEVWGDERIDGLLKLRVIARYGVATGDLGADKAANPGEIAALAGPVWQGEKSDLEQAVADYIRLEEMAAVSPKAPIPRERPTGGKMVGPVFSERRGTPAWRDQFTAFAKGRGAGDAMISAGINAIGEYLSAVKGFYRTFWPAALRRSIEGHVADKAKVEVEAKAKAKVKVEIDQVYRLILEFLPQIGVSTTIRDERRTSLDRDVEGALAGWIAEDYLAFFPSTLEGNTQVPVDLELLTDLASLHIAEHIEASPNRPLILASARQQLTDANGEREAAAWDRDTVAGLPEGGLFHARFEGFAERHAGEGNAADTDIVRRAYFRLLPEIRRGNAVSSERIAGALRTAGGASADGPENARMLEAFIRHQQESLRTLHDAITDREDGIAPYMQRHFHAGIVEGGAVEALAYAYAATRVTETLPVDLSALSVDAADPQLSDYPETLSAMARFQAHVAGAYLADAAARAERVVDDARETLRTIGDDEMSPPRSLDEMLQTAAELMGKPSFDDILETERLHALLAELGIGSLYASSLEALAGEIYERDVVPHQAARARQEADWEEGLRAAIDRIAGLAGRSVAFAADLNAAPDIGGMTRGDAEAVTAQMEAGFDTLISLQGELEQAPAVERGGAIDTIKKLGRDPVADYAETRLSAALRAAGIDVPAGDATTPDIIGRTTESLRTLLDGLGDTITARHAASVARAASAGAEEEAQKLEAEAASAADHITTAAGVLEATVVAISKTIEEGTTSKKFADVQSHLLKEIAAINSFELFDRANEAKDGLQEIMADLKNHFERIRDLIRMVRTPDGTATTELLGDARQRLGGAGKNRAQLQEAIGRLEAAEEGVNALLMRIDEMETIFNARMEGILRAIDAASIHLPLADPVGLAESNALPDTDTVTSADGTEYHFAASDIKPKYLGQVQRYFDPILKAEILNTRAGSFLISSDEGRRVRGWIDGGRAGGLTITHLLGGGTTLNEGDFSASIRDAGVADQNHPLPRIVRTLKAALTKNSPEIGVLAVILRGSPQRGAAANTLPFGLLSAFGANDAAETPEAAHGLIRRWALANREVLTAAFPTDSKRWFEAVPRPQAGLEPIYGADYTATLHARPARVREASYEEPAAGHVTLIGPDGRQYPLIVDDPYALEGKAEFRIFGDSDWETVKLDQIFGAPKDTRHTVVAAVPGFNFWGAPANAKDGLLSHRIHSDPRLMALGWLKMESEVSNTKNATSGFRTFVYQLLKPFREAVGDAVGDPAYPITLEAAQELAVMVYREYFGPEGTAEPDPSLARSPFLTEPDRELAEQFPETARVGSYQVMGISRTLKQKGIEGMAGIEPLMRFFPEFAGALAIIAAAQDTLPEEFKTELSRIFQKSFDIMDAFGGPELAKWQESLGLGSPDARRAALRRDFIRLYESQAGDTAGHDAIRRGLKAETGFGLTHARWLTGTDEPWVREPATWDDMDPVERLRLMLPEGFRVSEEGYSFFDLIPRAAEGMPDSEKSIGLHGLYSRFMADFPELSGFPILILFSGKTSADESPREFEPITEYLRDYVAAADSGRLDRPAFLKRFAEVMTAPDVIKELRRGLQVKRPDGKTSYARWLTGRDRPWLPEYAPAPVKPIEAQPPIPDHAPPEEAPIYGTKYSSEHHAKAKELLYADVQAAKERWYRNPDTARTLSLGLKIFGDPSLTSLGWLFSEVMKERSEFIDTGFWHFLANLFQMLMYSGPNHPLTFEMAQEFAVRRYRDYFEHGLKDDRESAFGALFEAPDEKLHNEFPETGRVGSWQIDTIYTGLAAAAPHGNMPNHFPGYDAGAISIISEVWPRLPLGFTEALFRLTEDYSAAMRKAEPERSRAIDALRRRFVGLYRSSRDKIIAALKEEKSPGLTKAEWLTGVAEPWKPEAKTWDEVEPMERLRLVMPEAFKISGERIDELRRIARAEQQKVRVENHPAFLSLLMLDRFPEVVGLVAIQNLVAISLIKDEGRHAGLIDRLSRFAVRIMDEIRSGDRSNPDILKEFIEFHTDPEYVKVVRQVLGEKFADTGLTLAEFLTDSKRPWLP